MKQAQRKQPVVSVENAPGEVIILPPVQVRRTTPTVTRWLRELTQRLLPPLLGLGVLLLAWQLAAMHSKGFPTPLSTLDSALTLFADPFYQDGPNDMGIGWNVLASLQRVAVGFGLAALAGIPLGFLIGRSLFFARMFNPLIAGVRLSIGIAWLVIVAAEMLTGGLGIGFWIWNEWNNLNVENIIIAIVIIGVVGLLLEQGLMLLARRFSWQDK